MSLVRWNLPGEFDSSLREIDKSSSALRRADWVPLVDIRENAAAYMIDVEVPAVASGDLSVTTVDGLLTVSGKSERPKKDQGYQYHRSERRQGSFVRTFKLPEEADAEDISAEIKKGVLYLSVPKRAEVQPRKVEIKFRE